MRVQFTRHLTPMTSQEPFISFLMCLVYLKQQETASATHYSIKGTCEHCLFNPCTKLTRGHVDLTAYFCMKVNIAVQLLSGTVTMRLRNTTDRKCLKLSILLECSISSLTV